MRRLTLLLLILFLPVTGAQAAPPNPTAVAAEVANETIRLGEILSAAGSLPIIGAENTPNAPSTRGQMLERLITARLLYLDGRDRKLDQTPLYDQDLHAFADPTLAASYLQRLQQDHPLTDEAFRAAVEKGGATDPAAQLRLRGKLLADHEQQLRADAATRLRAGAKIAIHKENLEPANDVPRDPLAPVATVDRATIRWRRLLPLLPTTPKTVSDRTQAVERLIDQHLLANAARQQGLDRDETFTKALAGFHRQELVNLVREEIVAREGLDDAAVEKQYQDHLDLWTLQEQRKVQQIVVKTKAEAEAISKILQAPPKGTTFFTLARDRSIVPDHEQTLGMLGWVTRAQGDARLTSAAFALKVGEVSPPVETEAGYHLIRVVDQRPAEVVPLDADTRYKITARWNADHIQAYANRLAKERYKVTLHPEVYELGAAAQPAETK
ncbi:MAG: hypothetical protein COW73_07780 [Nitrospirae bacterium CG18_big_fil_WC_8_21_14_2_50_70_55]|nr:peptidyl-prolyl cis-trans isomerase [Deltaproteobacteria bacterium]OIP66886.1 MAG: hypothetical protein AUK30_01485 [Nitrospirae bacterium CG2_30_70_394]PIQ04462.1 MAG: hypothetical protein COW73_07780 [Nitrospirae bacterium CG18_big_fil_WC_8_21_14_2_50_70_55]PIU77598.1 MAG: hypothetical protein COS73_09735 [Nitrospirae bacterium CG06_land_8_20_14_3_00_70_43]PIW82820.1 MAG: hypothetical protein COZ96_06725 [Nitrospirae bacterium CG_4_8_14_3_um_filter_70_85]PIX83565.1 MAG: hypothetical prote